MEGTGTERKYLVPDSVYAAVQPSGGSGSHCYFSVSMQRGLQLERVCPGIGSGGIDVSYYRCQRWDEPVGICTFGTWGQEFSIPDPDVVYFPIVLLIFAATVAGSQLGWVENLVYTAREGRMSFGFIYPTDCAAHFLFLGLGYWYMRGKKLYYPEILVFFALGLAAWYGCKGRFSTVLLMLVTASALTYLFLSKRVKDPQRWDQMCQGIPSKILVLVPLLCNLGVHIISICYSDANEFLVWFNRILSNRLSLVKKGNRYLWIPVMGQ